MANQGEFSSGGVTFVNSLPTPSAGMVGLIFYLRQIDGDKIPGFYNVKEDGAGGYQFFSFGASALSSSGGSPSIFIYDIQPQPSETSKAITNKITASGGHVTEEADSNTNLVRVFVRATGGSEYLPEATINGVNVIFSLDGNGPEFNGYADINLGPSSGGSYDADILADHSDGPYDVAIVHVIFGPQITSIVFSNQPSTSSPYPQFTANSTTVTQTEVKAGDTIYLTVTSSPSSPEMTGIQFLAGGVFASNYYHALGTATRSVTIPLTVTQTDTLGESAVTAKAHKSDLAYGDQFVSTSSASGQTTINVNNTSPSVSIGAITYPGSQQAIKGSESATLAVTMTQDGMIPVLFSTPLTQLSWTGTSGPYTVQRISGGYNISQNNASITVWRGANGKTATANAIVKIADDAAVITVSEPVMRSSPSGNNSTVTISANQQLLNAPTLGVPEGTWQGAGFAGGPSVWTRSLQITDANIKGTYSWGALLATNLAGVQTALINGDSQYTIAGFLQRQVNFTPAFSNEKAIGTTVSNTSNLVLSDLGGTPFTYQSSFTNNQFTYTITNGSGVITPTGTHVWITDQNWISQNATGTAYVNVQENA
jgi:hypothetical protein